jgi:hypothetical protein
VTAGTGSARSVSDEAPVGPEPMTLRAVRRRPVDPTAVAGLDEIANHGLTVIPDEQSVGLSEIQGHCALALPIAVRVGWARLGSRA